MRRGDPDRAVAHRALDAFGIEGRLRRVATGLDSTYRATTADGPGIALRVGGPFAMRRPEALAMEAAWVDDLRHTDVRVPAVRRTREGERVAVLVDGEGRRRGCLALDWLRGTKMRWRFTRHHAAGLGAAAARLHRHASRFEAPLDAWAKTWTPEAMCRLAQADAVAAVAGGQARGVVAGVSLRLAGAARDLGDHDWLLINADVGPHNAVWADGVPGLFDFNDLGWGYAGFDFARYLHSLRWRPRGDELVAVAVDGYESVAPLPESWRRHGTLFETAAGLFLAAYLAPKVAERGPEAAATVRQLVDRAAEFLGA